MDQVQVRKMKLADFFRLGKKYANTMAKILQETAFS